MFDKEYKEYLESKELVSEEVIEKALIHHLVHNLGYVYREDIKDYSQLKSNFRKHIEELNDYKFDDKDFEIIWTKFDSGDVYSRFIKLKTDLIRVNDKKRGIQRNLDYFDFEHPERNKFEVINQLWTKNKDNGDNRFDVIILINGIPIAHIELKREDINNYASLKQLERYKDIEAISNFLNFTKFYIHSNGEQTRYFANNNYDKNKRIVKSFIWTDENNQPINKLTSFMDTLFNKTTIIDFIKNYFVINKSKQLIYVFRPYQYYACKKIINQINNSELNNKQKSGYVWHATGSGKTLTCFKTCEILSNECKNVDLTIFLIDRSDLDYQTVDNFKNFTTNESLVCNALSTDNLIKILNDPNSNKKIIVTTIQKLNRALAQNNVDRMLSISNKNIVFMVDEGHRSQIGIMRKNIEKFFKNAINIAFTGTPIFDINSKDGMTTKNIFGEEIHRYRSLDAIRDANVLPFSFSFANSLEGIKENSEYDDELEEALENIDNVEINECRVTNIINYIKNNYDRLTINRKFNALLACSSIPEAIEYYKVLSNTTDLKVGIIYSTRSSDYSSEYDISKYSTEFLLERIKEYNETWDFNAFDKFKTNIQDDFSKHRKYDILVVVSMLLTGFDSPITNTIFLDKKLRYQGLVQAISRTNRVYDGKQAGNIICFKTPKEDVVEAFDLYTNGGMNTPKGEKWEVLVYDDIKLQFINVIKELRNRYPDLSKVFDISENDDDECYEFVKLFSSIIKIYNKIRTLPEFKWDDFELTNREYNQLKGKYNTITEKNKNKKLVYVYDDFEIVDFDTLEVNLNFLKSLVKDIKKYNGDVDIEDYKCIEDSPAFKYLDNLVNEKAKNNNQKEILSGFIRTPDIYKKNITFEDFKIIWDKYIENKIETISQQAQINWKASSTAINNLIDELIIKKSLDHEFIDHELPLYTDDPLDDLALVKYEEVENIIRELITLKDLKEMIFE